MEDMRGASEFEMDEYNSGYAIICKDTCYVISFWFDWDKYIRRNNGLFYLRRE